MSVKTDESGRRWVAVEVEVPGTPEQVWRAIATGEGVSSWFVPTEIGEEDEDGNPTKVVSRFGPGMDVVAEVEEWQPPHRFTAQGEAAPGAPSIATEWTVEARGGGTCVVRVVHSLFADGDDWDDQLEGAESGWPAFFRILRLYLTHFGGENGVPVQVLAPAGGDTERAWESLTAPLGLAGAAVSDRFETPDGAPRMAGRVEQAPSSEGGHPNELLLRIDQPAPGLAHLFALPMGPQVMVVARLYLYGDGAPEAAARAEPAWNAWLGARFTPAQGESPPES